MTRKVGLPLAEAFVAFEAGRYGECVDKIMATRGLAQRFGGSHAQRDVLTLTALHAALRGGLAPQPPKPSPPNAWRTSRKVLGPGASHERCRR
jgi:hypothetical protein